MHQASFCAIVYKVNAIIPGEIAANNTHIKKSLLKTVLTNKTSSTTVKWQQT